MASSFLLTVVVALMVMSVSVSTAQAQAECASKLVPCAQYLNATTKPPNTCCDPIKEAVATDLQCLCNLYENPAFLSGIGINIDQALRLPQLCGIPSDTSACNTTGQQSFSLITILLQLFRSHDTKSVFSTMFFDPPLKPITQ